MCSPSLAGNAGVGMQAAGAGMSAASTYYGAVMQKSALNFQADIANINARMSEVSAKQELERGSFQEKQVRLQSENLKSSQRAAMAANGIMLGEGTAADIIKSTDYMTEMDVDTVRANAARAAFGYRTQGMNYRAQAGAARAGADGVSPWLQTSASLLGSAGNVATSWYQVNKK